MARFVTTEWTRMQLASPKCVVLDPRPFTHYLQGHLKNAINVPLAKGLDGDGRLCSVTQLASWMGSAGVNEHNVPLVYDAYDGQNAAMLAWILEYLGRTDVCVMDVFLEQWVAEGREIYFRQGVLVADGVGAGRSADTSERSSGVEGAWGRFHPV